MGITIIIFIIGALFALFFKKFNHFVYYICFMDILFRVLHFIANNLGIKFIATFINNYFPSSIDWMIRQYSAGIFTTILTWIFVGIYVILDLYLLKLFLKLK